jgi:hypothetical protein
LYVLVKDSTTQKSRYHIVIVDAIKIEVLKRFEVTDIPDLIGSFKGTNHFLVNGNFYTMNSVYRLDPINQS